VTFGNMIYGALGQIINLSDDLAFCLAAFHIVLHGHNVRLLDDSIEDSAQNFYRNVVCRFDPRAGMCGELIELGRIETVKDFLGFVSGACRPVMMQTHLEKEGFEQVERSYYNNKSWFPVNWLTGTEIVTGYKPILQKS